MWIWYGHNIYMYIFGLGSVLEGFGFVWFEIKLTRIICYLNHWIFRALLLIIFINWMASSGLPAVVVGDRTNAVSAGSPVRPSSVSRSHWHQYPQLHRCHPKNVCHGCCYSNSEFFLPKKKGPLRAASVIAMWLFCFPCILCVVMFCFLPDDSST